MQKIAPLTSRALLRLDGSDVVGFLQNLVTCEVEDLDIGAASFGALLTPQGKILFDFLMLREADGFILDVDREQRDALSKRLTFYKLRADVQISNDQREVFAGWPVSESRPDRSFVDPRQENLGWRLYGEGLDTNTDEADWNEKRIASGVPQSGSDFELGSLFPHDALMDQWQQGGVDFSKGCYVGQEVVSRMQHRGAARNRFVLVSSGKVFPGNLVGTNLTTNGKRIGTMGSSTGSSGLALVRLDRIGSALDANTPIMIGEIGVELSLPEFATFGWPQ